MIWYNTGKKVDLIERDKEKVVVEVRMAGSRQACMMRGYKASECTEYMAHVLLFRDDKWVIFWISLEDI